jgi:hypothetical protein
MISAKLIIKETEAKSGAKAALDTANAMIEKYKATNNILFKHFSDTELGDVVKELYEKVYPGQTFPADTTAVAQN